MRSSEWVAFLYFLYLALVCWLRPVPSLRRLLVTGGSIAMMLLLLALAAWAPAVARDWAPMLSVTVGYYLTGRLFVRASEPLEAWLMAWDHRLLGDPTTRFSHWPGWLVGYLDVVYMLTFLILPFGYALLAATGRSMLANRYWTMVVAADLGAFAPLSLFQTRPPWSLEPPAVLRSRGVHRLASAMVENATIRVNTFPSGHAAVSIAVAMGVVQAMPLAGALLLIVAASINVACVVGRYHYTIDVVTGALLGSTVCAIVILCGV